MNLYKETLKLITNLNLSTKDIIFIGAQATGHSCTWDEFKTLADQEYDNKYGAPMVATDLIIAFGSGALLYREHDGDYERWGYRRQFRIPAETRPIKLLVVKKPSQCGWWTVEEIEENDERYEIEENKKPAEDPEFIEGPASRATSEVSGGTTMADLTKPRQCAKNKEKEND